MLSSWQLTFAQKKVNYRKVAVVDSAVGLASFYSDWFIGKKTANGERFSQQKMTCAHNTLPFGTKVKVTDIKTGKSVVVRVNDRLHRHNPRLVDLSKAAAAKLGLRKKGIIKVSVVVIRDETIEVKQPNE
jgi:rare lipoprotein A